MCPLRFCCFAALLACSSCSARIISIADLHGDLDRTEDILVAAGLMDRLTRSWIGGNTTLVQTGDIVDRGDYAKQIYRIFFRLADEAAAAGGRVINLLGNHEAMNIEGDLRYVSRGDYAAFGGREARKAAWGPQGWLGERVRKFPAVAVVDGVLFTHAGLTPEFLEENGIQSVNDAMSQALSQDGSPHSKFLGEQGPIWTRVYADSPDAVACADAAKVLGHVGAIKMVVGHTVQRQGRARCDGRVILADTGISSKYGGVANYVEHEGRDSWFVYPPDTTRHWLPRPDLPNIEVSAEHGKIYRTASNSKDGMLNRGQSDFNNDPFFDTCKCDTCWSGAGDCSINLCVFVGIPFLLFCFCCWAGKGYLSNQQMKRDNQARNVQMQQASPQAPQMHPQYAEQQGAIPLMPQAMPQMAMQQQGIPQAPQMAMPQDRPLTSLCRVESLKRRSSPKPTAPRGSGESREVARMSIQTGTDMFQVQVPENAWPGDAMQVHTPTGQTMQTVVPKGLKPGDAFNVQF